jgi:hypothetical protein
VQREWRRKKEDRTAKRVEAYRGPGMIILAMVMPCSTSYPETLEKELRHIAVLWLPHRLTTHPSLTVCGIKQSLCAPIFVV